MNGPSEQQRGTMDALQHSVQTGVAALIENARIKGRRLPQVEPKFLRVGVNSALVEASAMARLLIEKGVIAEDDYWNAIVQGWREEAARYSKDVAEALGRTVTLV